MTGSFLLVATGALLALRDDAPAPIIVLGIVLAWVGVARIHRKEV